MRRVLIGGAGAVFVCAGIVLLAAGAPGTAERLGRLSGILILIGIVLVGVAVVGRL